MKNLDVRITLLCGCRILTRNRPLSKHAKFTCSNNLGHAYNQGWLAYEYDEGVCRNTLFAPTM